MTPDTPKQAAASVPCRKCNRNLRNPDSIKHGYGTTCYKKVMNGNFKLARKSVIAGMSTITDPALAALTMRAIQRLIQRIPEVSDLYQFNCTICKATIKEMPLESFDAAHNSVEYRTFPLLPGFGKSQWFILHDQHAPVPLHKLNIGIPEILTEMKANGDIPQYWGMEP